MLVEAVCCDFERDGIHVAINNKCVSVVCHYCPTKMNLAIHKIKNNLRQNVLFVFSFLCFFFNITMMMLVSQVQRKCKFITRDL